MILYSITIISLTMFMLSEFFGNKISYLYAGNDEELLSICNHGFRIFSFNFMFVELSIFISSFFTSLNNGVISAILSFSRVFLFQIPLIIFLPKLFKLDGIWLSIPLAESLTVVMGIIFLLCNKRRYKY